MIDSETIEKLQSASVEDRIVIIETILRSLKADIATTAQSSPDIHSQRPAFGFMKDTIQILGDIVPPILPENTWDVLR